VVVRPDGHVAFRAQDSNGDLSVRLGSVLDRVLCRNATNSVSAKRA
jgi:hypothetical protein